ncbi:MAG: hypothetical protein GY868_15130, partial [Deltaproteobacteria bacterium]|nr:hypothetical protein [Deltaproteobacteria bacterium]
LEHLEDIIERYPSTSFRYEILYKMAYRCHVLYEIYSFSHNTPARNREAADRYRQKAIYLYKLALKSPRQTPYAQKAWQGLTTLESGSGRVYILQ